MNRWVLCVARVTAELMKFRTIPTTFFSPEAAGFDIGDIFIGVLLEELLAGGGATQAAQDA